jgi:hypothetical protein
MYITSTIGNGTAFLFTGVIGKASIAATRKPNNCDNNSMGEKSKIEYINKMTDRSQ